MALEESGEGMLGDSKDLLIALKHPVSSPQFELWPLIPGYLGDVCPKGRDLLANGLVTILQQLGDLIVCQCSEDCFHLHP